jgi:glycosyltransferase involved in cell wall biosynthesis
MKWNWFSPLPPCRSGIAMYTAAILPALREHAEVAVWTDQEEWDPSLGEFAEIRRFDPERISWPEVNRADLSFYNIGNSVHFHAGIWRVSRQHSGIVVLHDVRLHDFFAGMYLCLRKDGEGYRKMMQHHYGEEGALDADRFCHGERESVYMADRYPLTELATEGACGVVVHTEEAFKVARRHTRAAITCLELPYSAPSPVLPTALKQGPPYRLIVFGHLGANRCIDSILQGLAHFSERQQFRLDIYGQLWNEDSVRGQLSELRIEDIVRLHGFVEDSELCAALDAAHLAINLRYPTVGEASLSQLMIWAHSLPTLVTAVGWYAGLPQEAVAFVRPGHEVGDLQYHLRAFLADSDRFAQMGACGRRILEERHTPGKYVEALRQYSSDALRERLRGATRHLAASVGGELNRWMHPPALELSIDQTANEIQRLAGPAPRPRSLLMPS